MTSIFFVCAGEVTTYDPIGDGMDVPETGFLAELVAARSRGAAQYAVWKEHQRDLGDLHEQRWQTVSLGEAEREIGILRYDDPLWESPLCPEPAALRP